MIFRQFLHDDLGCASYVVGDADAGVAAVVDPRLQIDAYLGLARYLDLRIEHVRVARRRAKSQERRGDDNPGQHGAPKYRTATRSRWSRRSRSVELCVLRFP